MAYQPTDISALSRILSTVDTRQGPSRAAKELVTGIIKSKSEIGLETWEFYEAAAEGAGFSASGLTFKMQYFLHRYLTDIGAAIFNVIGAVLAVRWIVQKGIEGLKAIGRMVVGLLPAPVGAAVKGVYNFLTSDGEVQIMRDSDAGMTNLPREAVGDIFNGILATALPMGVWQLANRAVDSIGAAGQQPAQPAFQPTFQLPQLPQIQPPTVAQATPNTFGGIASGPISFAKQIGQQALGSLANFAVNKITGLFGDADNCSDADLDRVIYETAVANGVSPDVLKGAVLARLNGMRDEDEARDEDSLGYGFTLPDVDSDEAR